MQVLCFDSHVVVCGTLQIKDVKMLDWPLVAIMSLTSDGSYPHLVLQAKRDMRPADKEALSVYGEEPADDKTLPSVGAHPSSKLHLHHSAIMQVAPHILVEHHQPARSISVFNSLLESQPACLPLVLQLSTTPTRTAPCPSPFPPSCQSSKAVLVGGC